MRRPPERTASSVPPGVERKRRVRARWAGAARRSWPPRRLQRLPPAEVALEREPARALPLRQARIAAAARQREIRQPRPLGPAVRLPQEGRCCLLVRGETVAGLGWRCLVGSRSVGSRLAPARRQSRPVEVGRARVPLQRAAGELAAARAWQRGRGGKLELIPRSLPAQGAVAAAPRPQGAIPERREAVAEAALAGRLPAAAHPAAAEAAAPAAHQEAAAERPAPAPRKPAVAPPQEAAARHSTGRVAARPAKAARPAGRLRAGAAWARRLAAVEAVPERQAEQPDRSPAGEASRRRTAWGRPAWPAQRVSRRLALLAAARQAPASGPAAGRRGGCRSGRRPGRAPENRARRRRTTPVDPVRAAAQARSPSHRTG